MMNQEIQDDEVTIDLMELFSALWAKKTIIILSAVFMALVAFVGTKMFLWDEIFMKNWLKDIQRNSGEEIVKIFLRLLLNVYQFV